MDTIAGIPRGTPISILGKHFGLWGGAMDHPACTPQPAPSTGATLVLAEAIHALSARSAMGTRKYGTPLMTGNGRDAMEDWYQEQCDAFMYATQALLEWRALHKGDTDGSQSC